MKKTIMIAMLVSILVIASITAVSATYGCSGNGCSDIPTCPIGHTLIWGKITDASNGQLVSGADVEVICNGNNKDTTTNSHGIYWVIYPQNKCKVGNYVTVNAEKEELEGTETEKVNDWNGIFVDMERVDVPLIPEFGATVGILTLLGAVGTFFLVRRK